MQKIWMYIIAHFGAKCTFLRNNALLAPEKKGGKLTHGEPNWVFLGKNCAPPPKIFEHLLNTQKMRHVF